VDPGFEPAGVLTARVSPPASRYKGDAEIQAFANRLLERVRSLPGVEHAGFTSSIPFGEDFSDSVIFAEGYQPAPGESLISPYRVEVSPAYMEALGIPLRGGRTFTESDTSQSPLVVIVDERLARKFWPGADPVGRRMYKVNNPEEFGRPGASATWYSVVGVVGTTKMAGLVTADDRPGTYYFPASQDSPRTMTLAIRAGGNALSLAPAIRREVLAIDPELPLYSVRTMEDRMDASLVDRRTPMVLALVFAAVALFLAAVGLYGVLAYQVTQRSKEIGIRMALGSDSRAIFVMVVKEGLVLLSVGLVVGLIGAFGMRRAMEAQLYGTSGLDPVVIGSVAAVLGLVAMIACMVPARRAARIDPMVALTEA
jgi:predicted permease